MEASQLIEIEVPMDKLLKTLKRNRRSKRKLEQERKNSRVYRELMNHNADAAARSRAEANRLRFELALTQRTLAAVTQQAREDTEELHRELENTRKRLRDEHSDAIIRQGIIDLCQ